MFAYNAGRELLEHVGSLSVFFIEPGNITSTLLTYGFEAFIIIHCSLLVGIVVAN